VDGYERSLSVNNNGSFSGGLKWRFPHSHVGHLGVWTVTYGYMHLKAYCMHDMETSYNMHKCIIR
jgi:hypothetical protein